MNVSMTIDKQSVRKIQRNLQGMSESIKTRALRQGAYKVVQKITRDAKSRTPKGETGLLRRSVKAKVSGINRRRGSFTAWSGVDVNVRGTDKKGRPRHPAKYAHLVHDGFIHKGSNTQIAGRPFMRQAVAMMPNNGMDILVDETLAAAQRYNQ